MKEIIIIPHIGIGQLKLGMAPDELEKTLLQMKRQWSNSSNEAMQMERCAETDDPNLITGRYMDNDSFFLVQYRNGKATEIGIQRDLSKVASIKLFGMDMFNTTAECIIDSLMKKDKVICNEKDLQLGTEYIFPKSGVRLWRERAFHPKLLKDPLYMEEMQAVLEDEYQYQYFQMRTMSISFVGEESRSTILPASFAACVPLFMATATSACAKAGASLVPSPVMATK